MDWFKGTIPQAIAASRLRKCIFAVVITSEDESSQQLLVKLEEAEILSIFNNFISVSLKSGSVEANQFSQLYPVVVLPSIYLIDLQGTPLEVIGGLPDSSSLLGRAQAALSLLHQKENVPSPGEQPLPLKVKEKSAKKVAEASSHDHHDEAQDELAQSTSISEETNSDNNGRSSSIPSTELSLEARLEKANQLLAAVREKKADEEREKEKERERERREMGKQLQQFKEQQKEREQRELAESRQKEKREEKEALEKIRQQIAQDRAERSARYHAAQASEEERRRTAQNAQEQLKQERASAARNAFARLQFRLPDGSTQTEQFPSDFRLSQVTEFIDRSIQPPFKPYSVCTTFPRREFHKGDMESTLSDLGLAPSAALLIIPSGTTNLQTRGNGANGTPWIRWLFSPLFWIWNWAWVFFSPPSTAQVTQDGGQSPAARPEPRVSANQSGARRRKPQTSNPRRLGDASGGDSSDDNATWNGNSTQQI